MSNPAGFIFAGVAAAAVALTAISSSYVINEGNIGVITNMGQAIRQESPAGLRWRVPFVQGVSEFDVRERVLTGTFTATTSNQLTSTVNWSVNWRPDPSQILDIYVNYGSPEEFATNIILPRLNQALRTAIGQHTAVELATERNIVAETMYNIAITALGDYPVVISSVQLENYTLPERYWNAVLAREEQREVTERERLLLEQQNIQAQQAVQTAEAERDALRARADGEAYAVTTAATAEAEAIRLRAEAQADGIEVVQDAISGNPLFIEYTLAQQWDGTLPQQMIPGSTVPFIDVTP